MSVFKALYKIGSFAILLISEIIALLICLVLVAWVSSFWTGISDRPFRDRDCTADGQVEAAESIDELLGDNWDCRSQRLEVGDAGQMFSVNFLEFLESGAPAGARSSDGRAAQQVAFEMLLDQDESTYVIVFVHGWRNNADRYNNDLRKFQILLSYATAFVGKRCLAVKVHYCQTKVRGLFIGWRGASFREWAPEPLASLFSASTFMDRKVVSDPLPRENSWDPQQGLSAGIAVALRSIDERLSLRDERGVGGDRMLVLGHSLGGNALLQGFKSDVMSAVKAHKPGEVMRSPVGDLLLLINPATAAADWIEMTQPVREANLLRSTHRWNSASHDFFPPQQPPVVLALTATCPFADDRIGKWDTYWGEYFRQFAAALVGQADPPCDWVTGFALPLAQILLNDGRAYGIVAAGQLVPTEDCDEHETDVSCDRVWPPVLVGVTHGLELNRSAGKTSMANSWAEANNRCATVTGWLETARERAGPHHHYWDARNDLAPVRLAESGLEKLSVQFTHGGSIYRADNLIKTDPITAGNDPFWNVAAHSNAIQEHGGFVSYQVWCAINQFVLDDTSNQFIPSAGGEQ